MGVVVVVVATPVAVAVYQLMIGCITIMAWMKMTVAAYVIVCLACTYYTGRYVLLVVREVRPTYTEVCLPSDKDAPTYMRYIDTHENKTHENKLNHPASWSNIWRNRMK